MKNFIIILFLLSACSKQTDKSKKYQVDAVKIISPKVISDSTNTLSGKIETLELDYIIWGCPCASWITKVDKLKYINDKLSTLLKHCIFIEPSNNKLELPIYFDISRHSIKVKGQFYNKPDFPKGTIEKEEGVMMKAKVFQYNNLQVINSLPNLSKNTTETIILTYNDISYTYGQWIELNNKDKKKHIFLERADENLLNVDNLWNGNNLSLQIQVTGQFISESGFPFGYNPKKENLKKARVFRYEKIKVIKD